MGYFALNPGTIDKFNVEEVIEKNNKGEYSVLHLTILTEFGENKFRIHEKKQDLLEVIKNKLNEALTEISKADNDKFFSISVVEARSYLYIYYPDGEVEKYSGQKLEN
ncbi:MAG: hypothetical protein LBB89_11585 [Treponema sp.]|jgi:hypothetical protein|nr:hypothetical protein [Treponema sp.]